MQAKLKKLKTLRKIRLNLKEVKSKEKPNPAIKKAAEEDTAVPEQEKAHNICKLNI